MNKNKIFQVLEYKIFQVEVHSIKFRVNSLSHQIEQAMDQISLKVIQR